MHSAQTCALISYIYTTAEMIKCIPVFSPPSFISITLSRVLFSLFLRGVSWCICIEDALGFKLGGKYIYMFWPEFSLFLFYIVTLWESMILDN